MSTVLNPAPLSMQRAAWHAAQASALLAERGGSCHCDDENCPWQDPNRVAAALASAHAQAGALWAALGQAQDAGVTVPAPGDEWPA